MSNPGMTVLWSGILNHVFTETGQNLAPELLSSNTLFVPFLIFFGLTSRPSVESVKVLFLLWASCPYSIPACGMCSGLSVQSVTRQTSLAHTSSYTDCDLGVTGATFLSRSPAMISFSITTFRPRAKSIVSCFICIIHDTLLLESSYNSVILPLVSCLSSIVRQD